MKGHILSALLCVAMVYQLVSLAAGDVDAGMRVTVTEKALQEINRIEVAEIESAIDGKRFPDSSGKDEDFEWELKNLRISALSTLTTDLDLLAGNKITWSGNVGTVSVISDYYAEKAVLWFVPVWSSGSVEADLRGTSVSITARLSVTNGKLVIVLDHCSANIDDLDLVFKDSSVAWLLNLLSGLFEGTVEEKVQIAFCDAVRHALSELSQDMTNIKSLYDIKVIGIPIVLDTSFAAINVSHDNICAYNKGEFLWNHKRYSPADSGSEFLPMSDLGVGFDLKADVANNLLTAIAASGELNGEFAYKELKERGLDLLDLQCQDTCIGNAFEKVSLEHPNSVLGTHWSVSYGGLEVKTDELVGRLVGRVIFKAENETNQVFLFSASMNLTVHFQARFAEGNTLSFRAVGLGGQIVIDESVIGKVLSQNEQDIVEDDILNNLREELLHIINDYETDYVIPVPAGTSFKDAAIKLYPGVVRVETDICYKTICHFSGTSDWVGKYTTDSFDVQDIIPTTTTTTSTTTTTTTTTTTPPSTTPAPPTTTTTTTAPTTTTTTPPPTTPAEPTTRRDQQSGSEKHASGQGRPNFELLVLSFAYLLVQIL